MALTTGVGRRAAEPRSVETGQFRTVVLQVLCPQGPCGGRELGQQDSFPRRSPQTSQCNQNYPGFCSYKGKESCCSHLKILLTRKQRYETIGQDSSSRKVLVLPELRRAVFLPRRGGYPCRLRSPGSGHPCPVAAPSAPFGRRPLGEQAPGMPVSTCSLCPFGCNLTLLLGSRRTPGWQ